MKQVKRLGTVLLVFAFTGLVLGCAKNREVQLDLVVLFSGETLGHIEPCGCSKEELGGLSRRKMLTQHLVPPETQRYLLLDNGDLINRAGRQEELKYETAILVMNSMGYHALNVGEGDLILRPQFLHYITGLADFPLLCANLSRGEKKNLFAPFSLVSFSAGEISLTVGIIGVISDRYEADLQAREPQLTIHDPVRAVADLAGQLSEKADFIILLAHMPYEEARRVASQCPWLDLIIWGHGGGRIPTGTISKEGSTMLVTYREKGMSVGAMQLSFNRSKELIQKEYTLYPVNDQYKKDSDVVLLLRNYRHLLSVEDLLGLEQSKKTHFPGGGEYLSTDACGKCHPEELAVWTETAHTRAYDTLVPDDAHYDPECIGCHTTGFRYITGFVKEDTTPQLKDVGCEACHGPGSLHAQHPEKWHYPDAGEASCVRCHTTEIHPDFDFEESWEKIRH